MRVCLSAERVTAAIKDHLLAQARLFHERGDRVYCVLPAAHPLPADLDHLVEPGETAPASDLYIYHWEETQPPPVSLKARLAGIVLLHDHSDSTAPAAPRQTREDWLPFHFADLCLVDSPARREALLHRFALPPERVRALPPPHQQDAYRRAISELVDNLLANRWPPVHRDETPIPSLERKAEMTPTAPEARELLHLARSQADVMQRDYVVRSHIPLFGSLIAWVRRNLTSHLREPYLDPTLERQVAFNRTILNWMEQVQTRLETLETEMQRSQTFHKDGRLPGPQRRRSDVE